MDSGYYAAMTGLEARTQALDTAAANLANAQTPGFRAEREFFRSVLLGPDGADSQLGETVNNYGLLGGDRLSMAQGALVETGNPLDLAIEGQGFFMVQTPNGPRYTRDGSFHRTPNGQRARPSRFRRVRSLWASMDRSQWPAVWWGVSVSSIFPPERI
jgi:flagellar basal-body rod protein FlgF/flagellar basal-body rod protein FlgG